MLRFYPRELDKLQKETLNLEEMMDFMHESKLRIVEYKFARKEAHVNYNVLDVILNDIWTVLAELSSKSNLKFQRLTTLNETDQLDLVCSYLVAIILNLG